MAVVGWMSVNQSLIPILSAGHRTDEGTHLAPESAPAHRRPSPVDQRMCIWLCMLVEMSMMDLFPHLLLGVPLTSDGCPRDARLLLMLVLVHL